MFVMKELHDAEDATRPRSLQGSHLSSAKLMHDAELEHLVSSSVPSPTYAALPLLNASALGMFGGDPGAMFSAHLLASLAASNPNARFQLPISIPLAVPPGTNPLLHHHHHHLHHPSASVPMTGVLAGSSPPTAQQLDLLSNWVKEKSHDDKNNGPVIGRKSKAWATSDNNNDVHHPNNNHKGSGGGTHVKSNKTKSRHTVTNGRLSSSENELMMMDMKNSMEESSETEICKTNVGTKTDHHLHHHLSDLNKNNINTNGHGTSYKTKHGSQKGASNNNNNNNNTNTVNNNGSNALQSTPQSRDKVFTCPICNRCFGYKHVLQNHERTHTGEKPFHCVICSKRFTRDHHLKTHMRLHTGEKPYQCSHCDRQFVQVANLRRHLRVHTGEKPYACEVCPYRFSDSNQLKAHNLIHKGEKPHGCPDCGGRFRRRHHMVLHKCKDKSSSESLPPSPTEDVSPPPPHSKRERKARETRRIIRIEDLNKDNISEYISTMVQPEQTHPEDLSMSGNSLRSPRFSDSHSGCSASPSPPSGGSHPSPGLYCNSTTSSDPTDCYSDEELRHPTTRTSVMSTSN